MVRYTDRRVARWFGQFSDALRSGFTATDALSFTDALPKSLNLALKERFENGSSWEEAFNENCGFLTTSELAVVSAAERTGRLSETFEQLSKARHDIADTKQYAKRMLIYPALLLHLAIALVPLRHLSEKAYLKYGIELGMILIPFWVLLLMAGVAIRVWPGFRKRMASFVPIVRLYSRAKNLSVFSRVFAICTRAGISIDRCWRSSLEAADYRPLGSIGKKALNLIAQGQQASVAFEGERKPPRELKQLYRSGEATGSLDRTMDQAADYYAKIAHEKIRTAMAVYPTLILMGIVGFAAYQIAMFYQEHFEKILEILD